jgi:hypothetical protein
MYLYIVLCYWSWPLLTNYYYNFCYCFWLLVFKVHACIYSFSFVFLSGFFAHSFLHVFLLVSCPLYFSLYFKIFELFSLLVYSVPSAWSIRLLDRLFFFIPFTHPRPPYYHRTLKFLSVFLLSSPTTTLYNMYNTDASTTDFNHINIIVACLLNWLQKVQKRSCFNYPGWKAASKYMKLNMLTLTRRSAAS